jgi:hypothetical protein
VGRSRGASLALATIVLVNGLFVYNNLAPFFGLDFAGATTMFSALAEDFSEHLVMPYAPLKDDFAYVRIEQLGLPEAAGLPAWELGAFAAYAARTERLVNLNFLRYHLKRSCESTPGGRIRLAVRGQDGQQRRYDDVCAQPDLLWYSVLSGYRECKPDCRGVIRRWARSGLVGS